MHKMIGSTLLIVATVLVLAAGIVRGQEPFYKGKTIRIVVGFSAGGGFDIYSRVLARYMGKYIPGDPTIIVQNMTGAGSLITANHVYKVAAPDGLTIGHFAGSLLLGQVLGQKGIEFDARKFVYLGAPMTDHLVCALTKASGITSMEKWRASKTPVKMAGMGPGSTPDNALNVFSAALGFPIQLISGYKGAADITLAAEAGEVAGSCFGWNGMKNIWRRGLESGNMIVVLQASPKPLPEHPRVPLAIDFAQTEEARKLVQAGVHTPDVILRTYALPPGTPKDRVQMLRKAFMSTLKDPDFLVEAKKSNLEVNPVSGEELERIIEELFKLDAASQARLRKIILQQ